jgi:hypothetical protein
VTTPTVDTTAYVFDEYVVNVGTDLWVNVVVNVVVVNVGTGL